MRDHVYLPDLDLTRISEESISQNLSHVIDEAAGRTTNEHIYGYGEPHNTQNMVGMSISFTHDQGLDSTTAQSAASTMPYSFRGQPSPRAARDNNYALPVQQNTAQIPLQDPSSNFLKQTWACINAYNASSADQNPKEVAKLAKEAGVTTWELGCWFGLVPMIRECVQAKVPASFAQGPQSPSATRSTSRPNTDSLRGQLCYWSSSSSPGSRGFQSQVQNQEMSDPRRSQLSNPPASRKRGRGSNHLSGTTSIPVCMPSKRPKYSLAEKEYPCLECRKMCAADGWYDHLVRVHFPEYVWICECKENKDTDMHKLWPRLDNFLKHLVDKHEFLRSPAADASIRSLGLKVMDCYHQICGFCEAPLRNRQESLEHIEDHLDNGKQLRDWMHHCSSDHDLRSHIQEDWRKHMYISRVYQHGHNDDEEDRSDGFDASSNGRQHGHEIDKDPNASEKGASSSSRNFGSSQPHGNIPFDGEINLACEGSTPPPSFDLDADMLPFTWIRELGHGGYGIVDEVLSSSSKQTYARKTIRPRQTPHRTASHIAQLKNELQILRKLNHPHLIKLVGFYTDQTSFYVIMSPVADINLADYMRKPMSTTSLEQKILLMRWMSCLASAVGYLHDEKIRHRDIKPQNILVKGKNVYLTDLGNAKLFFDQNDISAEKMVTTPMYCAPETMSRGQQNCSADIFALGCVFIEMSNGYFGHSVLELDNFRLECGNRPYYLTATDTQGYLKRLVESHRDGLTSELILLFTLIGNMLEIQPSLRPKARDLQYLFPDRWRCWWSRTGLERLKDGTESNNLALLTPSQSPGLRPQP